MINLTELTVLNDLQEIRILELLEQNRQLKAKCKRLDEYDDLVDVNSAFVEALEAFKRWQTIGDVYLPELTQLVSQALALAEGDKDG